MQNALPFAKIIIYKIKEFVRNQKLNKNYCGFNYIIYMFIKCFKIKIKIYLIKLVVNCFN